MVLQRLAPGVQHGDDADLGAEMLGVGGDGAQRLGGGLEQDVVDHRLVVEGDGGDLGRQGEDDMEIGHWQQFGLAVGQPLGARQTLALGAVSVAAGIVGDAHDAAVGTGFGVAAKPRHAARLNGCHHLPLAAVDPAVAASAIGGAVVAEDIRHLQTPCHGQPVSPAAPRSAADGRAGSGSWRWWCWRPGCSAPWSTGCCGRAAPG